MLRKERTKTYLLSLAAAVLLICNLQTMRADPEILPLLWKYEEDGLTYERICKPGKLVIMSNYKNSPNYGYSYNYLIDLTDGRIVYKSNPNKEMGIYTNYFGDRYYVVSIEGLKVKEYDVKTNEFIREVLGPVSAPDLSMFSYNSFNHSLIFKNAITGHVLDSFKIPGTPNQPYLSLRDGRAITLDSKYFSFSLITNEKPYIKTFYLYDRVNREIIFEKKVEPYYGKYGYSFFNKSNKMAYPEKLKLPGDDTIYSYIRIFDPDLRQVIRNYRIDKLDIGGFIIHQDDSKLIYQLNDNKNPNVKKMYNMETETTYNYTFRTTGVGLLIVDSTCIYNYGGNLVSASKLDWTVGINYNSINEGSILYPNPVNNMLNISITNEYFGGFWNITDINGRIYNKGVILPMQNLQIDVSRLNTGNYYLTLLKDKLIKTYYFIRQ